MQISLQDAQHTLSLGCQLGKVLQAPACIYLEGELGAGKTTLVRGMLQGLGHQGVVPSPSYQIVQVYSLPQACVYHLDLYRLSGALELEALGLTDELSQAIFLIEWPSHGADAWLEPDWRCQMAVDNVGRLLEINAVSEHGQKLLQGISR